jgi:hypothetical protein
MESIRIYTLKETTVIMTGSRRINYGTHKEGKVVPVLN